MNKITARVLVTHGVWHRCPYREQDRSLISCYLNSEDSKDSYCFNCDVVPVLKEKYGLRTFRRVLVLNGAPTDSMKLYVPLASGDSAGWMIVDSLTGERKTLAEHRATSGMPSLKMDRLSGSAKSGTPNVARKEVARRAQETRNEDRYSRGRKK